MKKLLQKFKLLLTAIKPLMPDQKLMLILTALRPLLPKFSLFFRWYDIWVGIYIDTENHRIYVLPIPMLGIKITYPSRDVILYVFKWKKFCPHVTSFVTSGWGERLCRKTDDYVNWDYCKNHCGGKGDFE